MAVIFRNKELHDNNTLLIASSFEHLPNTCNLRLINAYLRAHDSNNSEELRHDDKCFAEITVVIFSRLLRRVLSVLRVVFHQRSIDTGSSDTRLMNQFHLTE